MADGLINNADQMDPTAQTTAAEQSAVQGALSQPTQASQGSGMTVPTPTTPQADLDPSSVEASVYESSQRDINPETDTVAGQMAGLLSEDSDYMKRAESKGLALANKRGLLNSSMAVEAAQAASIDAALPIAQQDADVYLRQGLENQSAENTARSTNAQLKTEAAFTKANMEMQRFSEVEASRRQELILATDIQTTQAKITAERVINNDRIAQADREAFTASFNEMARQNDVEITKIAIDAKLSEDSKNRLIASMNASYSANVTLLGDLYGLEISMDDMNRPGDYFPQPTEEEIAAAAVKDEKERQAQIDADYLAEVGGGGGGGDSGD